MMVQIVSRYGIHVICNTSLLYCYISHFYSTPFLSLTLYIFTFFVLISFVYFCIMHACMCVVTCLMSCLYECVLVHASCRHVFVSVYVMVCAMFVFV